MSLQCSTNVDAAMPCACSVVGDIMVKLSNKARLRLMFVLQERIALAKRWLERQPESVIVLYGHSVFWKTFFAHNESMRNCEYRVLHW